MKEILIPLNFTTTPTVYDTLQSFSTSDEASGVLTFTTTADVAGTVASLTLRNASENANRKTVRIERLDVNSSPFSYTFKNPLPFGQYEGTILLKKNLTVIASASFLFGVNSSLSAEVLPDLVKAYSLDELVENVETEVSNLKDAFTLTVRETVKGVNKTESSLQAQENVRSLNEHTRKTNEQARISAEAERKVTFDALVDSEVIELEVAEKYQEMEETYANRLLSTEQQLAEKRNKFEAIMMEDLHTEVKSAMTGGSVAVVGINSIGTENIKNKAVTGVKVDFLSQTKNLLNPYTTVIGKKLSYDGALYDDPLYQTSDFIEVKNGVTYTISKNSYYINMYTSENVFLNVLSSGTKTIPFTFIAPQDGYIRVTYLTIRSLSVAVGDDISLDPYGFRPNENMFNLNDAIKKTHIKNNVVSTQKTDFIIHSQNLFNKHDLEIIKGKYISSTGVLTDNPPTFVSGKIPVVPGEKYITTFFGNLNDENCGTYYNERDERIDTVTGVTTGSYRVITVPKNEMISYMKINHVLSAKEVLMIVKGEIYPSQYVSFYKRLDKTFVVSDDLLSDNIKSTTQSIVFNADRSVQKIQHKDSFGGIVRDDVFTYTTNQITEVRTLSDGQAVTYKYHLDTLETEII